ncbi:ERF superfamily protein [Candidatus Venteria ishoeyi]|uniref:ERF superfamily protein n=1 Tax=Candidatus Venteria ishoeyi TaxID=1899563 RepID=A0A1H6F842_9GAMM|nr:ERF superfamily protein [Candidatus Venteria ishoeyi]
MIKATATITNSKGTAISVVSFAGVDPSKKGMDISQTFGSSSSYARKYALNGLFAIDDTKDADTQAPPKTTAPAPAPAPAKLTMDFSNQRFIDCKNAFIDTPKEGEEAFLDKLKKAYSNSAELIDKIQKLKIANKL